MNDISKYTYEYLSYNLYHNMYSSLHCISTRRNKGILQLSIIHDTFVSIIYNHY